MLQQRGWLAGWVSNVYLSHAGIVSKRLFRPSGILPNYNSPIILVSSDSCADTQFQGEHLQWEF